MGVEHSIHYKGSYQGAMVLWQRLEDKYVHVELPRKDRKRLVRAQRRLQEWQVLMAQAELLEGQDREQRELLQRLDHERRELRARHVPELRELDRRHNRERKEMGLPPREWDQESLEPDPAPLVSLRQMFSADPFQVGIRFRCSGTLATIAETVEEFQEMAPGCEVEVQGEPHIANEGNPFPAQPHATRTPSVPRASTGCTGTTRAGARCKLEAGPDGLCPFHRPRGPQRSAQG
jgi:hypothetical protein